MNERMLWIVNKIQKSVDFHGIFSHCTFARDRVYSKEKTCDEMQETRNNYADQLHNQRKEKRVQKMQKTNLT